MSICPYNCVPGHLHIENTPGWEDNLFHPRCLSAGDDILNIDNYDFELI